MEEHLPSGELASLLERLGLVGGVVEYVLLDNTLQATTEHLHSLVAWMGTLIVHGRIDVHSPIAEIPAFELRPQIQRVGTPQSVSQFLQDYHVAFSNPPYPLYDRVRLERFSQESTNHLFGQINTLIFGELAAWTIRRWNTNWSSFFDPGEEWWGTYLWTLVENNHAHAVWIGAAATD